MATRAHAGRDRRRSLRPIEQTLEVFRLEGERYLLLGVHHAEENVRAEPFDAIELALGIHWAR